MKKWPIFAAALLLVLAGSLKFLQQGAAVKEAGVSAGDPLPGGNVPYFVPAEFAAVPPRFGPPSTYGALPIINEGPYSRGSCPGGSMNEILSAHGHIWGYQARYGSFEASENSDMYDLLGRYLSCVGLARSAPAFCDYLPGESRVGEFKVDLLSSPNFKCREYYMNVSFPGFAAGRDKDAASCRILQTGGNAAIGTRIPAEDFCVAASSGMEGMCGALSRFIPAKLSEKCRQALPASMRDCGPDRGCAARLAVYGAMKSGSPAGCPEDYRGLCSAFISRTEESCAPILEQLGTSYCGYLARAREKSGGYPGFSPEEVRTELKKYEEEKAWAEKQRLENQKIAEEMNKKVRKMMGRK